MSTQLIQKYYAEVEKLIHYGGSRNESSLRLAFIKLLEGYAASKNLVLVPEVEVRTPSMICGLQGAGHRTVEARVQGQRGDDEDCQGDA